MGVFATSPEDEAINLLIVAIVYIRIGIACEAVT